MKVRIKDLEPNPFRDMKNYPINPEKIESLTTSINQTGFWDNILARKSNGKIQIAYGHHRLMVLKRDFKPDHIIDIPVKDLDDATMIRIMANENDESWAITPGIIDETVRVTYEYLKNFFSLEKRSSQGRSATVFKELPIPKWIKEDPENGYRMTPLVKQISNWLDGNWTERRIYYSLERLNLIEEGILDKEAIESMPTDKAAQKFVSAIKKTGLKDKEAQKKVAERIVKEEDFSEEGIRSEVFEEKYHMEEEAKDKEQIRRQEFEYHLRQLTKKADSLYQDLINLLEYKDVLLSDYYQKSREGQDFVYSVARLFDTFRTLIAAKERRSDLIESFKLLVKSKEKGI